MAKDMSDYWQVYNQTLLGSEVAVTLPTNAFEVIFSANGGAITVSHASGGATLTIPDGGSYYLQNRNIQGGTFYFDGTATLEYAVTKGLAS